MKTIRSFLALLALSLLAFSIPVLQTGCSSPPSARVAQVQTLKSVGESAEAAVALSAHLYQAGTITAAQAKQVINFYDQRFQPAFRLAVTAVNANLDSIASPDILSLATQLATLVQSFQNHSP